MFRAALIKLTLLYLIIIMVISLFFSFILYSISSQAITDNAGRQKNAIERYGRGGGLLQNPEFLAERDRLAEESINNILVSLAYTNAVIMLVGGGLSYFLAGKTLAPIEEAHEAQVRFTGDASHELRSPLAAMKTELEVSLRNKDITKTEAVEQLRSNLEEVERLKLLTDGLLELTRNDGEILTKTDFPLDGAINNALKALKSKVSEKKVNLAKNTVPDIKIHGDKASIEELFVLVIDNAIKYSDTGKTLRIDATSKGKYAQIRIQDEGIGIAEEDIDKIFGRLFRIDQSRTKNKVPGYGLGLPLAKKIVTANSGSISVKSKLGSGSTFTIKLPLT